MARTTTFLVAVLLGVAAALGMTAVLRTVHLGGAAAKSSTVPDRLIAHRIARLNRSEVALRHALARRPPKLPRVPHYAPVHIPPRPPAPVVPAPAAAPAPAAPPRVQYYRPPPVIVHTHRAGGENEHEHEGHEHEGAGGGGDD